MTVRRRIPPLARDAILALLGLVALMEIAGGTAGPPHDWDGIRFWVACCVWLYLGWLGFRAYWRGAPNRSASTLWLLALWGGWRLWKVVEHGGAPRADASIGTQLGWYTGHMIWSTLAVLSALELARRAPILRTPRQLFARADRSTLWFGLLICPLAMLELVLLAWPTGLAAALLAAVVASPLLLVSWLCWDEILRRAPAGSPETQPTSLPPDDAPAGPVLPEADSGAATREQ